MKTLLPDSTLAEFSYEDVRGEIEAIKTSQSLLDSKLEQTRNEISQLHEIQVFKLYKKKKPKTKIIKTTIRE
ncbi:hypothetical protein RMBD61P2_25830 [Enterococcus faecalis]|nr:hypothetical protein EB38_02688 [Enterococcus faecalis]